VATITGAISGSTQTFSCTLPPSGLSPLRHCRAEAATSKHCVALLWFQYRDQPLTSRNLGPANQLVEGENNAFGIVDVTDTPKWDLVSKMRQANLNAASWRLREAGKR
jgi:hypothetical protein